MARNLSNSLCRAFNQLTNHRRIALHSSIIQSKLNFSSSALEKISKQKSLSLEHKFDLPKELTEEIDRELVPAEDFPVYTSPTFNFAAYIEKSETLQKFVKLGVNLSKIEKKKAIPWYFLKLDFDRDVKGHLLFLNDLGIEPEHYGHFITKNPTFFRNSLDDLETRIHYLRSKNFELEQVREIVTKDPFWLSFSTTRIDRRLGWFQKNFHLTGSDIRFLAAKYPRLITSHLMREIIFSVKEEMGFDQDQTKLLLLAVPKLFMKSKFVIFFLP